MSDNQVTQLLLYVLFFFIFVLFALVVVFIFVKMKDHQRKAEEKEKQKAEKEEPEPYYGNTATKGYNRQSIFKFMEFDKVEDYMVIQKNGNRYLMVVECQGVNYDLMSEMEQTAVETGFIQYLNSLRYPIQIYVQTRTVNLEGSLTNYNKRVDEIESNLRRKETEYESNRQSGEFTREELKAQFYELTKLRNLYEYGKDIIYNTQQMSLNKNVLNKQYYIILSYYPEELGNSNFGKEELKSIAFSELYTRCQSTINALAASGVVGKILNSNELVELLYMAYNRDEAEVFSLDKALEAGYDELYSTAQEVIDRRIAAIDREIEAKANTRAGDVVEKVRIDREREKRLHDREEKMDDIIDEMAKMIIQENAAYLGPEVVQDSVKELNESRRKRKEAKEKAEAEEEAKANGQKTVKRTRRKQTKTA